MYVFLRIIPLTKCLYNSLSGDLITAADCETLVKPIKGGKGKRKRTEKKAEHVPCAVALKISSDIPEYNRPVEWMVGEDCFVQFVDRLIEIYDWAKPILKPDKALIRPDPATLARMKSNPNCCICKEPLAGVRAHLDHDHRTGEALGM